MSIENPSKICITQGGKSLKTNCLGFVNGLPLLTKDLEEVENQIISLGKIAGIIELKISYEKTEMTALDPLIYK